MTMPNKDSAEPREEQLDKIMEDLIVGHNFEYARKALLEWDAAQVAAARTSGYDPNRQGSWVFIGDGARLENLDDLYWSYVMEEVARDSSPYDHLSLKYCKGNMKYAGFDKVGIHKLLARADQYAKERLAHLTTGQKEQVE
jgi:hypothetical protein